MIFERGDVVTVVGVSDDVMNDYITQNGLSRSLGTARNNNTRLRYDISLETVPVVGVICEVETKTTDACLYRVQTLPCVVREDGLVWLCAVNVIEHSSRKQLKLEVKV